MSSEAQEAARPPPQRVTAEQLAQVLQEPNLPLRIGANDHLGRLLPVAPVSGLEFVVKRHGQMQVGGVRLSHGLPHPRGRPRWFRYRRGQDENFYTLAFDKKRAPS
jgi:hypothetical protein